MKKSFHHKLLKTCSIIAILVSLLFLLKSGQNQPIRESIFITALLINIAILFGGIKENPADPWNQILAIWLLLGVFHPVARSISDQPYVKGQFGLSMLESMPKASIFFGIGMLCTLYGISRGENGNVSKIFLGTNRSLYLNPMHEFLLVIVWLIGTMLLFKQLGLSGLLHWRSRETQVALLSVSSYLFFTNYLLIVPGILRLIKLNKSKTDLGLGLFFLYAPVLLNTISGNRIYVIPILILHFYIFSAHKSKINFLKIFIFVMVIFLSISGLRFLRESSDPHSTYKNLSFSQKQSSIFSGQDLAMLDNLSLLVKSNEHNLEFPLIDYFNIFTKPIPRQFWPSKPLTFDQKINAIVLPSGFQTGYGFSFTFVGESLYEMGLVGIPLVGFLFGFFLGRCKRSITSGEFSKQYIVSIIAISMIIIFVRGSFSADSPRLIFALLPILVTKYRSLV